MNPDTHHFLSVNQSFTCSLARLKRLTSSTLFRFAFLGLVLLGFVLLGHTQAAFAEIQITDSHGKYRFAEPPKRVVALNWTLAEQMLELGETPVGMADIEGFRKHGKQPIIPDNVVNVGERLNPNLPAIRKLNPDIILIGYSQRSLLRPLSNIATVIYFKNFGKRYNNAAKSRERFLEMAKLFDKTEFAENKLHKADKRIEAMRLELSTKLIATFQEGKLPALQFVIPQSPAEAKRGKAIWTFGKNSMPFYAAQKLGLEVISPAETNQFGTAQLSFENLKALQNENDQDTCQVNLTSYQTATANNVQKNPSAECSFELDYQNAFGGAMSVLYLSEAIYKALSSQKSL